MKGLAFTVSMFLRLSEESPGRSVEAVVSDVEAYAARLVQAGNVIQGAFSDLGIGEPASPAASADVPAVAPAPDPKPDTAEILAEAQRIDAAPAAIVGGAGHVATGSTLDMPLTGYGGAGAPAATPPAPGIGGLPPGN